MNLARLCAALGLMLLQAQEPKARVEFQNIVVRPGDTLWSISNTYLKDPSKWDEILKHNKLPSSDPTVALPGMTLRIPIRLIKEELIAARLVKRVNEVVVRRKDTVKWDPAKEQMQLYRGDALRTLKEAHARVQFLDLDLFSLNPNSLAIIKPPNQKKFDIELTQGGVYAGNKKVFALGAEIIPLSKNTKFSATVRENQSTVVEVYAGKADVMAAGETVRVEAGKGTEIKLGAAPSAPLNIPDLPDFEARALQFDQSVRLMRVQAVKAPEARVQISKESVAVADMGQLKLDWEQMKVGIPVSGFRIQISATEDFSRLLINRVFEPDERFNSKTLGLAPGTYWGRIALIDLLDVQGEFSAPKRYRLK